ncbi:MAG: lipoate--protein ligase family protein [Deltaproteobacteria bacterium]|nr:lipoate--protein ligase family protein [Deltaproteobacteria bacterium]MBW1949721.1 lipoate--protein ligase family protein [Deltaproteobacteria bacterium]MBW2347473.1 lipoate--protein ligase family protein [Deltaproteobacteria bacterium]
MEPSPCRLLLLEVDSYATATMSLSPAMARAREEGKVPETLAMFSHRRPSIVMGRQNDPEVDVRSPYCLQEGITVKRVPTPGTIFGHPGYIMNVLYMDRDRVPESIPDIFALINRRVARAFFEAWGLRARHRPINDLEVETGEEWKKVGPFSISFFGSCVCCRMGLTITPIPYDLVERTMPGPPEKFADKKAKSVSQRVGYLEEALGRPVEIGEVQEVVRDALGDLFGFRFERGDLTDLEKRYEQELLDRYDNDEWFWANSIGRRFPEIPAGAALHEFVKKMPQGPLVRARVLAKGAHILDCSLTGWYHGMRPLDALERIEAALQGKSAHPEDILQAVEGVCQREGIQIDGCSPSDFQATVLEALEQPPLEGVRIQADPAPAL